jgi:hypothetical protein
LLAIGAGEEQKKFRSAFESALETSPLSLNPQHLGLNVDPNAPFNRFAAAAGLATLAWN